MSESQQCYLSPQEVADILGVGVSTVKRLVKERHLPARTTTGGHRRIEPGDVLRLVNSGNYPCAKRDFLLRLAGPMATLDFPTLQGRFYQALMDGNAIEARLIAVTTHASGVSIARLGDELIAPVMKQIGHGWATSDLDVYQEHRGTQTCLAALSGLRDRLEKNASRESPIAIGGGPEGDHYILANVLIELLLLEMGWQVVNIGPNTPMTSFARAIEDARPRLLWISCSYLPDEENFVSEYAALREVAQKFNVHVAVGGNALPDSVRQRITADHHGDTLANLAAFVQTLVET